jgi:hypothetical protein
MGLALSQALPAAEMYKLVGDYPSVTGSLRQNMWILRDS